MDRDTVLRTAERLIRQGRIDRAIAEYVRLTEAQPDDWTSINALGDLYVRTGDLDDAVTQFVRVADHEYDEGFLPRAAALYRKALRVNASDEHALLRLAEIAARQGLTGEARQHLRQVATQRERRGDTAKAAECVVRLGLLEDADAEAQLAAARAAQTLQEPAQAAALLKAAAESVAGDRPAEAQALLVEAARLDPADHRLRTRLAREALERGDEERAAEFLSPDVAADHPDLLLRLGRRDLRAGRSAEAFAAFTRFVAAAPARAGELVQLAADLGRGGDVAAGYGCLEIVADAALLDADWRRAVDVLDGFTRDHPHVPGLQKLVEVAGDAGFGEVQRDAQRRLVDTLVAEGRANEARDLARLFAGDEDTGARVETSGPGDGTPDQPGPAPIDAWPATAPPAFAPAPDEIATPRTAEEATAVDRPRDGYGFGMLDLFDVTDPELPVTGTPASPADVETPFSLNLQALMAELDASAVGEGPPSEGDVIEVDLSDAVSGWSGGPIDVEPAGGHPSLPPDPQLEAVFDDMRRKAARDQQFPDAEADYARGLAALEQGRTGEGLEALAAAARAPGLRFAASARLGAACLDSGDLGGSIEWFERAAAAPPPSAEEGYAVLDGLARALERSGETERALAVLLELDAETGGYRDVRDRIARLRAHDPGGRAT
jgi:tetratricopeptide (TPR) repeat protein